jgi:hypothetical protein
MQQRFAVGLAFGQPAQSTAVALVERVNPPGWYGSRECDSNQMILQVRGLRRFAPGTPYAEIGDELRKLLGKTELANAYRKVVVDQTAVGQPIVDMVLAKISAKDPVRTVIRGTDTIVESDGLYRIPKQHLISLLHVLLETSRLKFAEAMPETPQIVNELINYRNRTTGPSLVPDPWREYPNDDLIFAVALACWQLHQPKPFFEVSWV